MNEITEVPFDTTPTLDLVEILDEQGNPTGQYRPRETAPEGTTIVSAEDGEHVVN